MANDKDFRVKNGLDVGGNASVSGSVTTNTLIINDVAGSISKITNENNLSIYSDHIIDFKESDANQTVAQFGLNSNGNFTFGSSLDTNYKVKAVGNIYATTDLRSPIYYDSDNTSYYANLSDSGTSLYARGTIGNIVNQDTWAFRGVTANSGINFSGLWFTGDTARILLRDASGTIQTQLSADGTTANNKIGGNSIFHDGYHPNADKWTTTRTNTVTLTGDATGTGSASVDGTGNWTVTVNTTVGNDSHSHSDYVLKTGDNMSGNLNFTDQTKGTQFAVVTNASTPTYRTSGNAINGGSDYAGLSKLNNVAVETWYGFSVSPTISGQTVAQGSPAFSVNARNGFVYAAGYMYASVNQRVFADNYHPNADKWTTARTNTVTLTGSVTGTGSASVDGSGNWTVTVPTTTNHTHNYDNYVSWTAEDGDGTQYTVTSGDVLKFAEGSAIDVNFTADDVLTISHADTSSQASVNNSNGTVIQDVTLDGFGHVTGLASVDLDTRYVNVTGDTMTGTLVSPQIDFTNSTNTISATMLNTDTLSFSGDSGQLFSITDTLSGTIFAVNDISGVPSIEVDDDGTIRLAETFGNVLIGTAVDDGTNKVQIVGSVSIDGNTVFHDGYHPNADKWTTARTNTVTLTGSVTGTGSASVDGSGNWTVTVPTTTNHTHNYDNYVSWTAEDGDGTTYTVTSGDVLKFAEGGGIDVNFTADDVLTISHLDTSTQASVNNSNGTVIQDITLDTYGHITAIGSVDLDGRYQLIAAPAAPSITSTTLSGETVEIVFAQSATSGVNGYEIWSDGGGVSFALIGRIPAQDIAASMSFVDTTFTDTGTINYRVYAIRNGVYSTAATTNASFSVPSLDVANFAAIPDLNAFHLQYDLPVTRFLDHIEIYLDTNAASGSLARANASLIYSGDNPSYTHNISASDRDNYHQFWVECVGVA